MATTSTRSFGKLQLDKRYLASGNMGNVHDLYAAAVVNRGDVVRIVGHVSCAMSSVCYLLAATILKEGTTIERGPSGFVVMLKVLEQGHVEWSKEG